MTAIAFTFAMIVFNIVITTSCFTVKQKEMIHDPVRQTSMVVLPSITFSTRILRSYKFTDCLRRGFPIVRQNNIACNFDHVIVTLETVNSTPLLFGGP